MKYSLEHKLEAMRGPAMPADVEARVRRRILAEGIAPSRIPERRVLRNATSGQLALLLALLIAAGWVVQSSVLPTLRAAWERSHCAPVRSK